MDKSLKYCVVSLLIFSASLMLAMTVIQFIIGIIYLDDCPIQSLIPIYNLVAGLAGISISLLSLLLFIIYRSDKSKASAIKIPVIILLVLLVIFLFIWSIVGGYNTFSLGGNNITQYDNPNLSTYCNPVLFWMSFVIIIIYFSILALLGIDAAAVTSVFH